MDEKELIYLAGFLDGEGCIGTVLVRGYGNRANNTTPRQQIRISATNANKTVLEDLRLAFGGNVTPHHRSITGRKDVWRWTLPAKRASTALSLLLPYLRIKQHQAKLCLEYQATIVESSIDRSFLKGRLTTNTIKPRIENLRKEITSELNLLNMRGK